MLLKDAFIEEITERDRDAFDKAIHAPDYEPGGLALPADALRYLLIPRRLLEIVKDPQNVQIEQFPTAASHNLYASVNYWDTLPFVEQFELVKGYREYNLRRHRYQILGLALSRYDLDKKPILIVHNYSDKDKNRGRGVAKSFYDRLEDCARQMGFWAILGRNHAENIGFYTSVLGRNKVTDMSPEFVQLFIDDLGGGPHFNFLTIKLLDPEEHARYSRK